MNIVIGSPSGGEDILSRMRALRHGPREDRIRWLATVEWLVDDAAESLRLLQQLRMMTSAPSDQPVADYADIRDALGSMRRTLRAERAILNMLPQHLLGDDGEEGDDADGPALAPIHGDRAQHPGRRHPA